MSVTRAIMMVGLALTLFGGFMLVRKGATAPGARGVEAPARR